MFLTIILGIWNTNNPLSTEHLRTAEQIKLQSKMGKKLQQEFQTRIGGSLPAISLRSFSSRVTKMCKKSQAEHTKLCQVAFEILDQGNLLYKTSSLQM